jgi:NHL repeat
MVRFGPGRAGAAGRVLFVLEAQRAFAPVAGAAVAAAAAALATAAGANGGNGEDILRAWTPVPVPVAVPSIGAGAAAGGGLVTSLSRPMRLAVDGRRGTVYIADTGHHRILEVDVDSPTTTDAAANSGVTGRVRRVIGSPSGVAGAAADGTTAGKALFNRPMGLAVGFDGVLTVADAGNDAVRRIQLYDSSSSSSSSSSNAVSSALPEQASTGLKGFATTAAIAGHRARSLTLSLSPLSPSPRFATTAAIAGHRARSLTHSLSPLSPSPRFATTAAIAGPDTDGDGVVYDFAEVR